jgi:DNA-binding HxlR family transcriptional regulator
MVDICKKKMNNKIKILYETPKNPASFGGITRFIKSIKNKILEQKISKML